MVTNSAPPVLLVHGWAGSFERTWLRSGLVDLLEESGRSVLRYDLPGHGTSTKSHHPEDYGDLPHDVLAAISSQANGVVDVVGFSLGAITVLHALVRTPSAFGKVVLAGIGDGVFLPHDPARAERILSGLEGRAEPGDLTARIFGKIGNESHNDPLALAAVLRRPRSAPLSANDLHGVDNSVLLVLGDKDFSAPATQLAAALPNARLLSLSGVDHFRTPESFGFIDGVLEFLNAA